MSKNVVWRLVALFMVFALALSACAPAATPTAAPTKAEEPAAAPTTAPEKTEPTAASAEPTATTAAAAPAEDEEFVFGMLLVGPYNDHGYSEAHYNGGLYVEKNMPGAKMIYVEKVNPADRPGTTPAQLAEDLLSKGAKAIIFNSDDMKDSALDFARAHPDVPVVHASGDTVWADGKNYEDLPNLSNLFGRMEYGKAIAGCAAAMTTKTGQIGYLGPLINDETRRLASSAYLGARYCWTNFLNNDPNDLKFKVTWIGFWFNIPGVTSDPTQVADDFYNSGYDVVISGIDTTEGLTEARKMKEAGKDVAAVPYDYEGACSEAEDVCLGVPYFNWGPVYLQYMQSVKDGTVASSWEWLAPDWSDINNHDTSIVGFLKGDALSEEASAAVDTYIKELAEGKALWEGPINLQDSTPYLAEGEVATDEQIWYLPSLLEGMEGQSVSQ
jgi:simple sugar transport system substrate-binding protein